MPTVLAPRAAALRGFGPVGILAILIIVLAGNIFPGGIALPLGAVLVLAWAKASETPWAEIGYAPPKRWALTVAGGIVLGATLKLVLKIVVMPLLGAPAINSTYHYLAGNRAALPAAMWAMLVAGFGEETVFRGFFFERLGKLLGSGAGARIGIVLITSLLFGLAHLPDQGLAGAEQAWITGLVFGSVFALTGRIWLSMISHAAFDLTALTIIYLDLETAAAHLLFR